MPTTFDTLQPASFDGIPFPWEDIDILGVLRDHVHEFPHSPGGQPEKMGRKNYEFTFTVPFFSTFPKYPDLYPTSLAVMQGKYEKQITSILVVPTMGRIHGYIRKIQRRATSKNLSGERVTLVFIEDEPEAFTTDKLVAEGTNSLSSQRDNFMADVASIAAEDKAQAKLYIDNSDAVSSAVDSVLGFKDSIDIFGDKLESSVLHLAQTCDDFDRAAHLNDSGAARAIDSLQALWASTVKLQNDILGKKSEIQVYTTPTKLSITQVSTKLYGDTTHSIELLQLNPIDDAFSIPANTPIRYYPAS